MLVLKYVLMVLAGALVGVVASFAGIGGGVIIVPLLIVLGYTAQRAVGTSVLAILVIAVSSIVAHHRLENVDYRVGLLMGLGGVVGAQVGASLLEDISTAGFKRVFALMLAALSIYIFFKK